jgi:hypothetical protein
MTKVDLLFSASSRPEFTCASLAALRDNTDWSLIRGLWVYLDSPSKALNAVVADWLRAGPPIPFGDADSPGLYLFMNHFGGPVAIMNHWLAETAYTRVDNLVLAKIDNDVIVPPGWLEAATGVMDSHQELDLLGLEPPLSRTPAPWANGHRPPAPELDPRHRGHNVDARFGGYARCDAVGGVGLFRRRAFANRPRMFPHSTYGGFTDWQLASADLVKGWIVPPLALFLLDRLPIEPWATFSRDYIALGHQRPWTSYSPEDASLWQWWLDSQAG